MSARIAFSILVSIAWAGCASRTRLPLPPPPMQLSATSPYVLDDAPRGVPTTALPTLPVVETRALPNGMTLFFVSRTDLPIVTVRYACRASGTHDREARPGVDELLEPVLGQIGHLHSPGLRGSSEPTVDVSSTGVWIQAEGSTSSLGGMIDTIAFMARSPEYTLEVLAPQRHILLQTIAGQSRGPSWMLGIQEREMIFGPHDPRAAVWWGSAPEFGRLHPEDLAARHAQLFTPSESAIVVVGDAQIEDVEREVGAAFADWSAPAIHGTPLAGAAFPTPTARLRGIPSGGDESQLRVREHAPMRDDPDRPAFELVTALLGGMFSARLNHVLREERGHTYGVNAFINDYRAYSIFTIDLEVPVVHMRSTLLTLVEELERVTQEGAIDADELETARSSTLASYRNYFFTRSNVANAIASAFMRGTTIDAVLERARAITTVTAADVTRVAQRWIRADACPILVLGPYLSLSANIRGLPGGHEVVEWRW